MVENKQITHSRSASSEHKNTTPYAPELSVRSTRHLLLNGLRLTKCWKLEGNFIKFWRVYAELLTSSSSFASFFAFASILETWNERENMLDNKNFANFRKPTLSGRSVLMFLVTRDSFGVSDGIWWAMCNAGQWRQMNNRDLWNECENDWKGRKTNVLYAKVSGGITK